MFLIGRGRYARETYPESNKATAALVNRYLISAAGPPRPDPFSKIPADVYVVAATNVTRRASGIFMLTFQDPVTLAAADTLEWSAIAFSGSTASGGTVSGDWLVRIGSDIAFTAPAAASPMGEYADQRDATTLSATVTMVGVNAAPMLPGKGAIVVFGSAAAGTLITPALLIASVYELP